MINLILSLLMSISFADLKKPKTVKELKSVTAQISNPERTSGGSGTVIQADNSGSIILTNNHVCEAMEQGWIVTVNNNASKVNKFKKFDKHDLCLIQVSKNFGYHVNLSKRIPDVTETSIVSGHPLMLPQIVTEGHFSEEMDINIMVDVRECTEEEFASLGMQCMFGMPITRTFPSQMTSNLIQPGNSGSAVFNEKGEVAGVIFAGIGDIGFAFIVPAIYVTYFVVNSSAYKWETIQSNTSKEKDKKVKNFCVSNGNKACKFNDMLMR